MLLSRPQLSKPEIKPGAVKPKHCQHRRQGVPDGVTGKWFIIDIMKTKPFLFLLGLVVLSEKEYLPRIFFHILSNSVPIFKAGPEAFGPEALMNESAEWWEIEPFTLGLVLSVGSWRLLKEVIEPKSK